MLVSFLFLFVGTCFSSVPLEIQPIPEKYELWVGQDLEITCNVTGDQPIYVSWYENGEETGSSVLKLTSVTKEDSGTYMCIARNNGGLAFKQTNVRVIFYPISIKADNTVTEVEGKWPNDIRLQCFVDGGPMPFVTFYRETDQGKLKINEKLRKYHHVTVQNFVGDLSNERKHILRIIDLEPADSGSYFCRAENEYQFEEKEFTVTDNSKEDAQDET